jgi:hypothetical protein
METWHRNGYKIVEKDFDYDLHEFDIIKNGSIIATITPDSIDRMNSIVADLNSGECVDGWEDGKGNTIRVLD